jgi:histone deacetylase 11
MEPMCLGSAGSVDAAYLAMNKGWAINLSGGFHHATKYGGGGFCIYPDITFITQKLRHVYGIKKIMIVDLDAHQGNGHERDHLGDEDIHIFDAYNHMIYPGDVDA